MDEKNARMVRDLGIKVSAMLGQRLKELERDLPDEEYRRWRMQIAVVLSYVNTEIINPAVAEHPSLEPSEDEWAAVALERDE